MQIEITLSPAEHVYLYCKVEVELSWVSRQHEISRWQADTFINIVTFVGKYIFKKLCAWLLQKKHIQASLSSTFC